MSDLREYLEDPGNWGTLDGRPGLLRAMLDVLEAEHALDTAHAAATERERIAAWHESKGAVHLAALIRDGGHWMAATQ